VSAAYASRFVEVPAEAFEELHRIAALHGIDLSLLASVRELEGVVAIDYARHYRPEDLRKLQPGALDQLVRSEAGKVAEEWARTLRLVIERAGS
jgi:hypothetical protein